MNLDDIAVVDNHVHPLTYRQPETAAELRAHFSESPDAEMPERHIGTAAHYRWTLRQLAGHLGCGAGEEALLRARRERSLPDYARSLVAAARIDWLLLDVGFPPPAESYPPDELASMLGVRVGRILRIETFLQDLLREHDELDTALAAFDQVAGSLRDHGYVSLKSIAAYRTGLQIGPVPQGDAAAVYASVRELARQEGSVRINHKQLIDFFAWRAVGHAARQGMPIQFHTGYGDPDLDLRLANPLHLRPLFEEPAFRQAPIVLLHESYPFTGEAAYLACAYANAYVDLAFSLPPLARGELVRIVRQAVGAAPASKIMVSSDGTRIPEHYWLGAVRARDALSTVLTEMVDAGELDQEEARELAELMLRGNAYRVYQLPLNA